MQWNTRTPINTLCMRQVLTAYNDLLAQTFIDIPTLEQRGSSGRTTGERTSGSLSDLAISLSGEYSAGVHGR